jgi:hypothetical protein
MLGGKSIVGLEKDIIELFIVPFFGLPLAEIVENAELLENY